MDTVPDAAPYHTIQAALNDARPGDTIRVAPGVYRERVRFTNGGQSDAPVTLEGEPGAIIDGSTPAILDWQPAPDIGPDVWRASLPFSPFTVTANGKTLTTLDEHRTDTPPPTPPPHGWKPILWRDAFVNGVGPSGWRGVKALAMYRRSAKELLVRFGDGHDPRAMAITVAPKEAVVLIAGKNHCIVRGLTLRNAAYGVLIERSTGSIVEHCQIDPADYGVSLENAAARCIVRFNRITLAPYAGADPQGEGAWDNWQAMKTGGFYDRIGIAIRRTVGGHHIHDNYIHDHWDGIDDHGNPPWEKPPRPLAERTDNTGLRVHHNRIQNLADDGMETMGPGIDGQWHDNLIERTRCGFRIKAPQRGPLYLYRNIFIDNKEDFRHWGSGDQIYPDAIVWVYHNTSTSNAAVTMNYSVSSISVSASRYHYFNNLFWCRQWVEKSSRIPNPDWNADYNVFILETQKSPRPWVTAATASHTTTAMQDASKPTAWQAGITLTKQLNREQNSLWHEEGPPGFSDPAARNLALTANSPARARGIAPEKLPGAPILPGLAPGYYQGERPDAGALQFGEPMPRIPRDH
ncbi:hypothetical protein Ga0100231_003850 [Opitutaceae bacterium TAV4]|nr:hypothetical protein Ga0100231_003850 [Opitutaceae bacterium TAV4]RRK02059.1 hypothetical protein Ga0100230_002280 [Opitutaceae bacterium TAV3]